jgi:hypothetical protein
MWNQMINVGRPVLEKIVFHDVIVRSCYAATGPYLLGKDWQLTHISTRHLERITVPPFRVSPDNIRKSPSCKDPRTGIKPDGRQEATFLPHLTNRNEISIVYGHHNTSSDQRSR